MKPRHLVIAAAAGFTISGCIVSLPKYPPDWAPLKAASVPGCLDISGTYQNDGRLVGSHSPISTKLAPIMSHGSWSADLTGVIELQQGEGVILAQLTLPDGKLLASHISETKPCTATERYIARSNQQGFVSREGIAGYMGGGVTLMRSTDGSLVLRSTERDAVIALFIPVGTDVRSWASFPLAQAGPD